jgi:hypothetical protein
VATKPEEENDKDKGDVNPSAEEGVGPRFKKGTEDLDQLKGIEKQQERSRKARRKLEEEDSAEEPDPDQSYPLIEKIDKSRKRVKNRFRGIKHPEDAIDEFGS